MKLQVYTLRYLLIALLGVIALWASLFYMVILEEVYDNIDDGLKNSKLLIIRKAKESPELLTKHESEINQFTIKPVPMGRFIARNHSDDDDDDDNQDVIYNDHQYMEYDDDYEPVRVLKTVFMASDGNPYELTITASMVEEDELLEDLMTALIALYIMLVVSIVIINYFILKKVWRSFHSLLDKLRHFKLGTGTVFHAPPSPIDEFKVLGKELEALLKRNEATYNSQKQFIENASHELQTPLAISINRLELFAENNMLTEEQMEDVGKITDTLSRLVKLNKSLLMLSKIENRQFPDEEDIDFNELTEQIASDFDDFAAFKSVSLHIDQKEPLTFKMNKGLAVTLLSNLIKNAILHNQTGGTVAITLSEKQLIIRNSGSDQPLDPDFIFNRFARHGTNEHSTGLGLAIVQSIISNYNLYITYTFDKEHVFTITFP
ncbi:sensor histidine kinase [Flavobacterium cerinum]|uniref:histidine kinase n=1 Tax=Flavobacterium cerinum TaxID=2502784 RepID=A0ABY5IRM9_9FLAO|nr:HAMP domain-containing sensor histidine kinase [Flavobacterium cerinum]UUC45525.1 HAMP domain-containing histidine kinase [Flavobacterium cerinum]